MYLWAFASERCGYEGGSIYVYVVWDEDIEKNERKSEGRGEDGEKGGESKKRERGETNKMRGMGCKQTVTAV